MPGVFTKTLLLEVACPMISIGNYVTIFTTIVPGGNIFCFQAAPHGSTPIRSKIREMD